MGHAVRCDVRLCVLVVAKRDLNARGCECRLTSGSSGRVPAGFARLHAPLNRVVGVTSSGEAVKQSWVRAVILGLLVGGINWLGRGVALRSPEPFVLRDLATDFALIVVLSASFPYFFQGADASHGDLRRAMKRTAMALGVAAVVSGVVAILALSQPRVTHQERSTLA